MAARSTGDARFAYLSSADGLVPATPAWQRMALSTIPPVRLTKNTGRPSNIRGDGNKSASFVTGLETGGSLEGELIYGALDPWLEGVFRSTWASDVLTNGTTDKLFTAETAYRPAGGGAYDSFFRHTGLKAGGLTINIQPNSPVTFSIPVMGIGEQTGDAIVTNATYVDPVDGQVIVSGASVGEVLYDGAPKCLQSLNITLSTNPRRQPCIGNLESDGISHGPLMVDVTGSAFFATRAEYDKVTNHEALDLSFVLGSVAGSKYRVTIPALRGTNEIGGGGEDTDVTRSFTLMGEYDAGIGGTIKIERAVT